MSGIGASLTTTPKAEKQLFLLLCDQGPKARKKSFFKSFVRIKKVDRSTSSLKKEYTANDALWGRDYQSESESSFTSRFKELFLTAALSAAAFLAALRCLNGSPIARETQFHTQSIGWMHSLLPRLTA